MRLIGDYLLCSCGFFERLGIPCRHLFHILQRGPIPTDCATRWRRDYIAHGFTGNNEYDTAFRIAKKQETIGPFYKEPAEECPTCYPIFSPGSVGNIRFYEEPMECTMYAVRGSTVLYQTLLRKEKAVPDRELPSEIQLSQLTQELLDDDQEEANDQPSSYVEDTQAYHVLLPKFKQIVSVSDGNSRILGKAMKALRDTYSMVLSEAATENSGKNSSTTNISPSTAATGVATSTSNVRRFTSSSLELDMYKKSNKRIRPMGEWGNKKK